MAFEALTFRLGIFRTRDERAVQKIVKEIAYGWYLTLILLP